MAAAGAGLQLAIERTGGSPIARSRVVAGRQLGMMEIGSLGITRPWAMNPGFCGVMSRPLLTGACLPPYAE